MNIHVIACRVFTRELCYCISKSPNIVDVSFLPQGLHESPALLHSELEATLARFHDQVDSGQRRRKPDYIVLAFGLCSNSVVGLQARDIPLVVPCIDDCIGVYLGSRQRYIDVFAKHKGTYWAFPSWVESTPSTDENYLDMQRCEYMKRYDGDEEMVDELIDLERVMVANYSTVGYISSPLAIDPVASREHAMRYAQLSGWNFIEYEGDLSLMERMVNGPWDERDFLVVPPGHRVASASGPEKICAENIA